MEDFSNTLGIISAYIIIPEFVLLPAFQVIQQFKSLPDFLMFPVFLALRDQDQDHPSYALPLHCPPYTEIIHAMMAFVNVAKQVWEENVLESSSSLLAQKAVVLEGSMVLPPCFIRNAEVRKTLPHRTTLRRFPSTPPAPLTEAQYHCFLTLAGLAAQGKREQGVPVNNARRQSNTIFSGIAFDVT
ncbi:hypothetical protein DFH29DRAFT_1019300 [Suillus ampliporus]|nr:hypothetical protein DFH29DRAFT_1019300 [Suillus ampliporus]